MALKFEMVAISFWANDINYYQKCNSLFCIPIYILIYWKVKYIFLKKEAVHFFYLFTFSCMLLHLEIDRFPTLTKPFPIC